jgi:membrane associated rhomboid family serine protease
MIVRNVALRLDFAAVSESTSARGAAKMRLLCRYPLPQTEVCMVTLIIIAITCVVSFMAFNNARLMNDLILWPPAITRSREYHRLVTYGVVHADFGHLLFNMITLFFFGRTMEGFFTATLGTLGFALFYILALVVSILPTYLNNKNNPNYRSLGASGAVSAVLFSYVLLAPWSRIIVFVIPVPAIVYAVLYVAYSIYMDRRGQGNVNHSAHLWGAAFGVAFTVVVRPEVISHFLSALSQPRF